MSELKKIRRALISVSDKTGLAEFAKTLAEFGVELISTGGTAKFLRDNGFAVTDVSEVTGFPEMMDGRVKTLHPKIHGALLGLRDNSDHLASMDQHGIEPIDLVVVNLYPFEKTIAKHGVTLDDAVENIDIGGPAMIRSAAKNWRDVAVVTGVAQYDGIMAELRQREGSLMLQTRQRLANSAYARTAQYDAAISDFLTAANTSSPPYEGGVAGFGSPPARGGVAPASGDEVVGAGDGVVLSRNPEIRLTKITDLRYGENPHQTAALYKTDEGGIANAEKLHGKEMSFNNYVDADAAWQLVNDFDDLAVAIIKHTNPSGVGLGATNLEAYKRALSTDPVSAFGGIVAFNRVVDADAAKGVIEVFSEVVIAPDYEVDALEIFKSKKNLRIIKMGGNASVNERASSAEGVDTRASVRNLEYKQISGGFLVQYQDTHHLAAADLRIVTDRQPTDSEIEAMFFAWIVCKHVKSNAIVLANEYQTLGVGAGQRSEERRVG